ncbi:MAG: fimbrial protein [Rhodocyclaceae bacterium]
MKLKTTLSILAASGLLSLTGVAYADNTITFDGEVVDTTCEPAVANGDYTVVLDQVAKSDLSAVGIYSGVSTPFSLQFINCPATATQVGVVLNSSTYDATTGNLTDVAGYGSDAVQIAVQETAGGPVMVGAGAPASFVPVVNGTASIPLTANYYVKDIAGVTVGVIKTTAVYSVRTQ